MNRVVLAQKNASGLINCLLHRADHRNIGKYLFRESHIITHSPTLNFISSQQARRGTDYELYVELWYVYETRRMLEQLWKLCSGMLLWPFPASPTCGRLFPFWCWWHQCGWMYQRMRWSRLHACGTQVRNLNNLHCKSILSFRDRQFCHCGSVEPEIPDIVSLENRILRYQRLDLFF